MDIKKEFNNITRVEGVAITSIFAFIFVNALIMHDSLISVISAVCGISYTFMAGKGKAICYLFGVTGSFFYCVLAFKSALWGNLLLYGLYYIPMQILGFFKWNKHLNEKAEIKKISLPINERSLLSLLCLLGCGLLAWCLKITGDTSPLLDAITTILSIVGMYLTVRRAIEQWVAWIIVNALSALMWIQVLFTGEKVYATVIMWLVYLALGIYFLIKWKKEMKKSANDAIIK